jgi:hypothetical protein
MHYCFLCEAFLSVRPESAAGSAKWAPGSGKVWTSQLLSIPQEAAEQGERHHENA